MRFMCSNNLTLVRDLRHDDVAVRPVTANLVFVHHSHTHSVSGLVFADHDAYGEGSVLHQTDLHPAGENPASPSFSTDM